MSRIVKTGTFLDIKRPAREYLDPSMLSFDKLCMTYLVQQIKQENCALCLGAGASVKIGQPTWSELLSKLLEQLCIEDMTVKLTNEEKEYVPNIHLLHKMMRNKSIFQSIGTLETAEYIQLQLSNIAQRVAAYHGTQIPTERRELAYMASFVYAALELSKKCAKSPDWSLLNLLAELTLHKKGVHQIITYNYDDALEYAIQSQLGSTTTQDKYQSHGRLDSTVQQLDKKPLTHIYHVHGRLSIYIDNQQMLKDDIKQGVILSERSYQEIEHGAYGTTNTCQAQLFNANCCLFIGFSAQDYNYRRIVNGVPNNAQAFSLMYDRIKDNDTSKNKKGEMFQHPHFMLYPIDPLLEEIYKRSEDCKDIPDSEYEELCLFIFQNMIRAQSVYYQRHNVWPIYVKFEELAEYVKKLVDAVNGHDEVEV